MCGICGYFGLAHDEGAVIEQMTDSLRHRGPDASGIWNDRDRGIAFGHRRLSILDLSEAGAQPMLGGRYVISYNGEVYNHLALRRELEPLGHTFRGFSDTETILAAISQWGVAEAVKRFVGMFAIALWDAQERELILVRDRLGIKPLYYGHVGQSFVFASELKAIRAYPGFDGSIDRGALALYFRHNYIPAPFSIYENVRKLLPGAILRIRQGEEPRLDSYWSVSDVWSNAQPFAGSEADAVDQLESLIMDAVGMRMISDVPLGAFLSGGIDSSTVVALMQVQSSRPVKTYSIGFAEDKYNEADHARAVAAHLGTDHTELEVTSSDLLGVVPDIPSWWDEPFADSSQIPTYILSRLTRQHVTVSLSGDGGDELFCGYDRYYVTQRIWRLLGSVPHWVRKGVAGAASALPAGIFDLLGDFGRKASWRLDAIASGDAKALYRHLTSHFKQPTSFVLGANEPGTRMSDLPLSDDLWQWMSLHDLLGYLPDDILTKVDRASMAVSLEARVPLIDHRVVEFAARLPQAMKYRDGQSKWLLRQVLHRHVPRELVDRPKMGFGVPVREWLGGPLREWASDLLSPSNIAKGGFIDPVMVERMWREYLDGKGHWNFYLWDVLMFQAWLDRWE